MLPRLARRVVLCARRALGFAVAGCTRLARTRLLPPSGASLDLSGRVLATPAGGPSAASEHQARWAASVTPGLYFARLEAPGGTQRVIRVARYD